MTEVQTLAKFVIERDFQDLSDDAVKQLKIRVLDSIGCAFGALNAQPVRMIKSHIEDFGGNPLTSMIGGDMTSPEQSVLYNGFLVRYLDYNDSYLAAGETCHPSDNLAAVLAACEYADRSGKNLLVALAIAYQVQCRMSDEAPVRAKGFDHTTQGAYAVAAGVAKGLNLNGEKTANAIAISGTCNLALRVTRTGALSHWKGLAYPNTAFIGTHSAFLAMRGITGPSEVFEGDKGFKTLAGEFKIDWAQEDLDRISRTIIKKYNAEIHSQATIEGALELQAKHGFKAEDIASIEIQTFDVAYHIIGGGEEGDKTIVRTKEEADHSLHYMVAVALIDGQVLPGQYAQERILRHDVQDLLKKIKVKPNEQFSKAFPEKMPSYLLIKLQDGREIDINKIDYAGFYTRPFNWSNAVEKFETLATPYVVQSYLQEIKQAISEIEHLKIRDLTHLLRKKEMFHV